VGRRLVAAPRCHTLACGPALVHPGTGRPGSLFYVAARLSELLGGEPRPLPVQGWVVLLAGVVGGFVQAMLLVLVASMVVVWYGPDLRPPTADHQR
jgi:hypothetical protein